MSIPVIPSVPSVTTESDASNKGLGCCTQGTNPDLDRRNLDSIYGIKEATQHINYLELLAAFLAVKAFEKDWKDTAVLQCLDNNITVVSYINHKGAQPLCPAVQISHHSVDLVHFSEHHIDSRTPPRS